jgi:stage V sporulation protein AC
MEKTKKQKQIEQEYAKKVKEYTPTHSLPKEMLKAYFVGGIICTIGQGIIKTAMDYGLNKEDAGTVCTIVLVLISVILTGFNIYPRIAKFGGAGALVPITGFANSVAAPAIEFQKEGQVFGIGCKIFTISGPVILYGIFSSWVLGVIYWLGTILR